MINYHMPAEFEEQSAIWLAWPKALDWPGKYTAIQHVFCEIIRQIAATQQIVKLICDDSNTKQKALDLLEKSGANLTYIKMVTAKTNRNWLRDSGAIFVRRNKSKFDNEKYALGFHFNGWARYKNHGYDCKIPSVMAKQSGVKLIKPVHKNRHIVLEGGGVEVNGKGSIIVTEEWLLSDQQVRNPGFTQQDYEAIFAQYLGAQNTIWLKAGIAGDDTHGHVDDITRFASPNTVVTAVDKRRTDANYAVLRENLRRLKKAKNQNGKPLNVVELPMPQAVFYGGDRLPASYANFLITNKAVLVPVFNDVNDRYALNILADCFKGRQMIGIYARDLVLGLGAIHCLSQQEII